MNVLKAITVPPGEMSKMLAPHDTPSTAVVARHHRPNYIPPHDWLGTPRLMVRVGEWTDRKWLQVDEA